jgi:UDP-3-O-[3-hydroxymyristoyl] glucosamine N-acyltransferase
MTDERRETTSLAVLAELVGGSVSGDPSISVSGVATLDSAGPEDVSFLANPKYQAQLKDSKAAAIIAHPSLEGSVDTPLLLTSNPYLAFAKVLNYFWAADHKPLGIMNGTHVHPEAQVDAGVTISPGCVLEAGAQVGKGTILYPNVVLGRDVSVGENCILYPNVTIRERCRIGHRVIIQPGAVIGADGFGFAPDGQQYVKVPQTGIVIIEDDVEIGACSCVDRGTLGETRVARGCKIDNLVQIGHNVQVGEDTLLVSQVGISGSTEIGKHCTFGGQSATAGHITVGDNVTLAARGGISKNVDANQVLGGLPAMPHRDWLKVTMTMTHLPGMRKELHDLKKQVAELKRKLSEDKD